MGSDDIFSVEVNIKQGFASFCLFVFYWPLISWSYAHHSSPVMAIDFIKFCSN